MKGYLPRRRIYSSRTTVFSSPAVGVVCESYQRETSYFKSLIIQCPYKFSSQKMWSGYNTNCHILPTFCEECDETSEENMHADINTEQNIYCLDFLIIKKYRSTP